MACGWDGDEAVQDQINASMEDAVRQARNEIRNGESAEFCEECEGEIPEARRKAVAGVQLCTSCQSKAEAENAHRSMVNRRSGQLPYI